MTGSESRVLHGLKLTYSDPVVWGIAVTGIVMWFTSGSFLIGILWTAILQMAYLMESPLQEVWVSE